MGVVWSYGGIEKVEKEIEINKKITR